MKNSNQKGSQLQINFAANTNSKNVFSPGKVININQYSKKAFASYIVKNSKSF